MPLSAKAAYNLRRRRPRDKVADNLGALPGRYRVRASREREGNVKTTSGS